MDRAIGHILNVSGSIDSLINNAGVLFDEDRAGLYLSKDILNKTLETNTIGPLILMQKVIPIMQDNKYGRIVNVSTDMSLIRSMYSERLAYRISKSALNVMTKVLATEVSDDNILINAMSPGWVRTDMGGTNAPRSPEEVADTAVYLATLPDNGPSGCFFKDRKIVPW
jgi:NAD(P)-dependent dehydrogenase (short-subunit alcohol dehydrogenase family)